MRKINASRTTIMTGKDFARKIFSPVIWLNVLGMVVLVGLVGFATIWWMKDYTRHGVGVSVPSLKGKLISDAIIELTEMQLEGVVIDSSYNKKLTPGMVLDQTPGPGSYVKAGRQIYITINAKTEPTMPIPNLIENCSAREAEAKLQALGFKLTPYEYIEGQKDWVLGIKCRGRKIYAGERIPLTTPITLVVGNSEIEVDENGMEYENIGDEATWLNENEDGDFTEEGYESEFDDNNPTEILEY